ARYPVGNVIPGTVTNVTDYGLFVEVEEGIEGLIHVTELGKKVKSPSELFKEGDSVQAKIIHVSADERRLGLSIKQIKDDEERRKPKDYHSGDNSMTQTLGDLLRQKFDN
ncbi:MAG: S1 RNA-binding domain-containing protein, partial [Mailhella sp.]|nr:S1 RNA-binding domain-containing protein [Mailhella sp.]